MSTVHNIDSNISNNISKQSRNGNWLYANHGNRSIYANAVRSRNNTNKINSNRSYPVILGIGTLAIGSILGISIILNNYLKSKPYPFMFTEECCSKVFSAIDPDKKSIQVVESIENFNGDRTGVKFKEIVVNVVKSADSLKTDNNGGKAKEIVVVLPDFCNKKNTYKKHKDGWLHGNSSKHEPIQQPPSVDSNTAVVVKLDENKSRELAINELNDTEMLNERLNATYDCTLQFASQNCEIESDIIILNYLSPEVKGANGLDVAVEKCAKILESELKDYSKSLESGQKIKLTFIGDGTGIPVAHELMKQEFSKPFEKQFHIFDNPDSKVPISTFISPHNWSLEPSLQSIIESEEERPEDVHYVESSLFDSEAVKGIKVCSELGYVIIQPKKITISPSTQTKPESGSEGGAKKFDGTDRQIQNPPVGSGSSSSTQGRSGASRITADGGNPSQIAGQSAGSGSSPSPSIPGSSSGKQGVIPGGGRPGRPSGEQARSGASILAAGESVGSSPSPKKSDERRDVISEVGQPVTPSGKLHDTGARPKEKKILTKTSVRKSGKDAENKVRTGDQNPSVTASSVPNEGMLPKVQSADSPAGQFSKGGKLNPAKTKEVTNIVPTNGQSSGPTSKHESPFGNQRDSGARTKQTENVIQQNVLQSGEYVENIVRAGDQNPNVTESSVPNNEMPPKVQSVDSPTTELLKDEASLHIKTNEKVMPKVEANGRSSDSTSNMTSAASSQSENVSEPSQLNNQIKQDVLGAGSPVVETKKNLPGPNDLQPEKQGVETDRQQSPLPLPVQPMEPATSSLGFPARITSGKENTDVDAIAKQMEPETQPPASPAGIISANDGTGVDAILQQQESKNNADTDPTIKPASDHVDVSVSTEDAVKLQDPPVDIPKSNVEADQKVSSQHNKVQAIQSENGTGGNVQNEGRISDSESDPASDCDLYDVSDISGALDKSPDDPSDTLSEQQSFGSEKSFSIIPFPSVDSESGKIFRSTNEASSTDNSITYLESGETNQDSNHNLSIESNNLQKLTSIGPQTNTPGFDLLDFNRSTKFNFENTNKITKDKVFLHVSRNPPQSRVAAQPGQIITSQGLNINAPESTAEEQGKALRNSRAEESSNESPGRPRSPPRNFEKRPFTAEDSATFYKLIPLPSGNVDNSALTIGAYNLSPSPKLNATYEVPPVEIGDEDDLEVDFSD